MTHAQDQYFNNFEIAIKEEDENKDNEDHEQSNASNKCKDAAFTEKRQDPRREKRRNRGGYRGNRDKIKKKINNHKS